MRYDSEWDVVVVGAGPGGLVCAKELAARGKRVLAIDRKQELGTPKRCGEGLSMRWVKVGKQKPDPRWALQEITGIILISPSGKVIEVDTSEGGHTGYIIERKMWEKELAAEAIRAGAKIMLKADVYDVIKDDGCVVGVKVRHEGEEKELRAKIVVAADGVDSMVARFAGLKTAMALDECDSGYQYEMANVKLMDHNKMELYFGREVAPRGYVWVFPKGKDTANVGIGILGSDTESAKKYLDRWLEANSKRFKDSSIIEINTGVIPVTSSIDEMAACGLMVVGDAARMVNPIHGGGIGPAMEAGMIAAEVGAKAIDDGDVSEGRLSEYQKIWQDKRGKEFANILRVRKFFEKLDDEQLEILATTVDPKLILGLGRGEGLAKVAKALLKASPSAAKFALSFLK